MAKITFDCNIGKKDAILRTVGEGENKYSVCDFFACENVKTSNGEKRGVWYKITLWRGYAEAMAKYLTSGRFLMVEGSISKEPHVYTKDNAVKAYVEVNADKIRFLDNKGKPEEITPEDADSEVETTEETPWG